ncbi:mitochondrial metallochaperone Sco1 [Massariosphaeria phaeospora]|uniref:Mitochondrial metallochaperone Sco1 n=1 Tax=Massariosphaeria phaeospora TaxID=100035 RepID=A0A7C8M957_9PLEO|nr:mitochondrial metallochaperone Sco1 [Massariosphaeria phaeospora]
MATPCHCLAGAARSLRAAPALRGSPLRTSSAARRTFASQHSSSSGLPVRPKTQQSPCTLRKQQPGVQSRGWAWGEGQSRGFSKTAARHKLKTIEEVRARNKGGPFNLTAAVLFVSAGGAMYAYFTYEKERLARKRIAEQTKGMGKPKVGGWFDLMDQDGNKFCSDDMAGQYALVYFGFSHCPDICPDELDKMALMYDKVVEKCGKVLLPIMITCDPARDTPKVLKDYLQEFHPEMIGLTGDYEAIKQTCKAYRVYFSTPPTVKPGQDYLVDHSIYFYLMDPDGDFVEAIGRNFTADQAAKVITDHIKDWQGPLKKKKEW